jgi:hypothetical protein
MGPWIDEEGSLSEVEKKNKKKKRQKQRPATGANVVIIEATIDFLLVCLLTRRTQNSVFTACCNYYGGMDKRQ